MAKKEKEKQSAAKVVFVVAVAIIILLGLMGTDIFSGFANRKTKLSTREIALSCTTDALTRFHIHPTPSIIINGAKQEIPKNTGITPGCMHPIHTHDEAGIIHVESPEKRDFTLGDFFAVWDKPFSKDQILDSKADDAHEIVMTVDGKVSDKYENLIFEDEQQITIEYKSKSAASAAVSSEIPLVVP